MAGRRGGKDRLDGAAVQRRGATASGREETGVGGSEAGPQERGVQCTERKADRRGKVNKVHEGRERGTEGCRGMDRERQGNREREARGS